MQGVQATREGVFEKRQIIRSAGQTWRTERQVWLHTNLRKCRRIGALGHGKHAAQWGGALGNSEQVLDRVNMESPKSCNAPPGIAQDKENVRPCKNLGTNAHGSTIPNGQGGADQVPIVDGR